MSIPIHLSYYANEPDGSSNLHITACGTWGDYMTKDTKKVECGNCKRTKVFQKRRRRQLSEKKTKPLVPLTDEELKEYGLSPDWKGFAFWDCDGFLVTVAMGKDVKSKMIPRNGH